MLLNTNLYGNIMFTDNVNQSIVWDGKGKDIVRLIKNLIIARVWRGAWGGAKKNLTGTGLNDRKVRADTR